MTIPLTDPLPGEAIMSVIAIAIAEEKGLDIVTSSGNVHRALATLDEDAVFTNLLGSKAKIPPRSGYNPQTEMADELVQVVMHTAFDLSKLSAIQIRDLLSEGKDLRQFKKGVLEISEMIPDIRDPVEREKRLKAAAQEVLDAWKKYKKSLPWFALDAIKSSLDYKSPDITGKIIAGASSVAPLFGAAGLAIGLAAFTGYSVWRGYKEKISNPYQYLSRIEKTGATLAPAAKARGK